MYLIAYVGKAVMKDRGFTLVEIMIVVAIIGILASVSIPSIIAARKKADTNACISNMRQIETAIERWAIDTGAADTATISTSDIAPNYIKSWPKCQNTAYDAPANVTSSPVCPNNLEGHTLGDSGGGGGSQQRPPPANPFQ